MNGYMAIAFSCVLIACVIILSGCEAERLRPYERAYFEGQRDAINGDIRIERENGIWRWKKTCWDDGTPVTFDPSSQ